MGEVIQVAFTEDQRRCVGPAKCFNCKHEWEAIVPFDARMEAMLECPACGQQKGCLFHIYVPQKQESYMICVDCGCELFYVLEDGRALCVNCGERIEI